jgi:hypothetical protein
LNVGSVSILKNITVLTFIKMILHVSVWEGREWGVFKFNNHDNEFENILLEREKKST